MEESITYDDIVLVPAYNHYASRQLVDISVTDRTGRLTLALPIMSANMDTITEAAMANYINGKGGIGVLHRFMSIEENVRIFKMCRHPVFVSIGCTSGEIDRAAALRDSGAELFCMDVAHAHGRYVGRAFKKLRELLGKHTFVMAGNVATYAGADYLASCGADMIKVGIGGGSVCTTRIKAGFGVPNLTAIRECAKVDRSIVADGGIRNPGDIVKALAFGADFVMTGALLAGTRPTPGPVIRRTAPDGEERQVKLYRGMASQEVVIEQFGVMAGWKTAEGISVEIPYRETEDAIIADIIGGLRSGLTYGGAATVRELQRKLDYRRVSWAGRIEGGPHIRQS
jgi:IMP dehydrogenase